MTDDTSLVVAAQQGDRDAFAALFGRWFDRCWDVAWRIVRDHELAADVAQDAMLTVWERLDSLDRPASFGGWVLRITRNRALDRLERERRTVPEPDHGRLEPREHRATSDDPEVAVVRAAEHDLVWTAATALGERDASMLDLHLRHGLEPAELAVELGIAPNAAHQALYRLRVRLAKAIRAWMLWHGGAPRCASLADAARAAGVDRFGPELVRLVGQHVQACDECAAEQDRVTKPAALFAAVPLVAVPEVLRSQAAQALAAHGVPVQAPDANPATSSGAVPTATETPTVPAVPASSWPKDLSGHTAGHPTAHATRGARAPVALLGAVLAGILVGGALGAWLHQPGAPGAAQAPPTSAEATHEHPIEATPTEVPQPAAPAPATEPPEGSATTDVDETVAGTGTGTGTGSSPAGPRAPRVLRLAAQPSDGHECPAEAPFAYEVTWATADAESVELVGPGGAEAVELDGRAVYCGAQTAEFTLRLEGAGATASETVEVATPVPQ